ncbi:Uncharacterised protein [Mycobacteroides abscessus subsp. abscessus]|nr:Uncharacterised protein [Mycobacteroides abscessus subsp. abscessus]
MREQVEVLKNHAYFLPHLHNIRFPAGYFLFADEYPAIRWLLKQIQAPQKC